MRPLALAVLLTACAEPAGVPDFALQDVNPSSPTFEQAVGPADFEGQVSAWYFGWATCPICQRHMEALQVLADDLDLPEGAAHVTVLGINEAGRESGNEAMTGLVDLPWLQDTATDDVFGRWPPGTIRELKIVGPEGDVVDVFDLNRDDPAEADARAAIEAALVDAATGG